MSDAPENPPVYPDPSNDLEKGMRLRDVFAAAALASPLIEINDDCDIQQGVAQLANACYTIAEAMLKERERRMET